MPSRIYLDHNSTTPLHPKVAEAMLRYAAEHTGNPASAHRAGAKARTTLEAARKTVADLLGAFPDEVFFTSGATEANNLAILGSGATQVYVSEIEHPSVLGPARQLQSRGVALHSLSVQPSGLIDSALLPCGDNQQTAVLIQLANHETGVVQDVTALRRLVPDAHFHCDATQAVGKIPIGFHELEVSTLAGSAHKFNGPAGIGFLLVNRCTRIKSQLFGGHQQGSTRPGTEPVMMAVGLAEALRLAVTEMAERRQMCERLREMFLEVLQKSLSKSAEDCSPLAPNPSPSRGEGNLVLPHTLNLSFPGCSSDLLFIRLDLAGIDCSTGSACSSGSLLPSPVLKAMGVPEEVLKSAMRFSLSHVLSEGEVVEAATRIATEVNRLRFSPLRRSGC
jgi:cysteine desulfurase